MNTPQAHRRLQRTFAAVMAIGSAAVLVAGCTRPGTPPTTTTTTMPGGMDHGDNGGMDHGGGERLNHPPTPAQEAWARKLIADTKAALLAKFPTTTQANLAGYNDIGDGQHWTHPRYRHDGKQFDVNAVESLVFNRVTRQIEAAMYNMEPETTVDNVEDYAGNWIVWHGHENLCWQSNVEGTPGYTRLGGVVINGQCTSGYTHGVVLMVHVWVVQNSISRQCGAFATIPGLGEGSCLPFLQP